MQCWLITLLPPDPPPPSSGAYRAVYAGHRVADQPPSPPQCMRTEQCTRGTVSHRPAVERASDSAKPCFLLPQTAYRCIQWWHTNTLSKCSVVLTHHPPLVTLISLRAPGCTVLPSPCKQLLPCTHHSPLVTLSSLRAARFAARIFLPQSLCSQAHALYYVSDWERVQHVDTERSI